MCLAFLARLKPSQISLTSWGRLEARQGREKHDCGGEDRQEYLRERADSARSGMRTALGLCPEQGDPGRNAQDQPNLEVAVPRVTP